MLAAEWTAACRVGAEWFWMCTSKVYANVVKVAIISCALSEVRTQVCMEVQFSSWLWESHD